MDAVMNKDEYGRLVVLEQTAEDAQATIERLEAKQDEMQKNIALLLKRFDRIDTVVGAGLWLFGTMFVAIKWLWEPLTGWLRGEGWRW